MAASSALGTAWDPVVAAAAAAAAVDVCRSVAAAASAVAAATTTVAAAALRLPRVLRGRLINDGVEGSVPSSYYTNSFTISSRAPTVQGLCTVTCRIRGGIGLSLLTSKLQDSQGSCIHFSYQTNLSIS